MTVSAWGAKVPAQAPDLAGAIGGLWGIVIEPRLPLTGVRVLDFSQVAFGPVCTRLMGDLGADVIKVEPLEGDFVRLSATQAGDSAFFLQANRSKKSLALNLRDEQGQDIARKLAARVDVIVQNFRPGVMKRLGLDYETVAKFNPRLVYGSFSMYGETGPLANVPGGDPWAQAFTGVVAGQGTPEGPPYLAGHAFIDLGGAALNAFALVSALFMRDQTGVGQEVTNSLVNTGIFMQELPLAYLLIDGTLMKKGGRGNVLGYFPYGAYPAKDGDVVTIFGQSDSEWLTVCVILGIEHLLSDPRYDSHEKRVQRRSELYPLLDDAFRQKTRAEWQASFRAHGLRCDPCLDYAELVAHPQYRAVDMQVQVNHTTMGPITMPGIPVKFNGIGAIQPQLAPPLLGEHTREILGALEFSSAEIEALIEQGTVGVPSADMLEPKPRLGGPIVFSLDRGKPGKGAGVKQGPSSLPGQ